MRLATGDRLTLLDRLDLRVKAHEAVAIMGPSGSGKTTLLRSLGLFAPFDVGRHHLLGVDVRTAGDRRCSWLRAEKIGFVFQEFRLLPNLNAVQNVEYACVMAGMSRRLRREATGEALARVGLSERGRSRPATLSGGEQQRVAIARALVKRPALILADEPTGALDRRTAERVMDLLLRAVVDIGAALVVVTHDDEVAARCHRRLELRDGSLYERAGTDPEPIAGPR